VRTLRNDGDEYVSDPLTVFIKGYPENVTGERLRASAKSIMAQALPRDAVEKAKVFARSCSTAVRVVLPHLTAVTAMLDHSRVGSL